MQRLHAAHSASGNLITQPSGASYSMFRGVNRQEVALAYFLTSTLMHKLHAYSSSHSQSLNMITT